MRSRVVIAAVLLATAGCGGASQVAAPHASSGGKGTLSLNLRVPARPPAAHGARAPRYISAGTKSLSVADAGGPTLAFDVGPTAPGCAGSSGAVTCTFALILPVDQQTLTVSAYDGAVAGGVAQGAVLSTVTTQLFIYEAQVNTLDIVLGGVIADLSLSVAPIVLWDSSTANITIVAKDADGYTIAGAYGTPITVTYAGNTFALLDDYAPDPLTDSSQVTDIVSPFGGVVAGTVTASTASSPAVTKSVPLTGVIQSGTFVLSNTENVSGMQYGAVDISTPIDRAGQPNIVVPLQFYNGTSKIEGVAFDPGGNVVIANAGSMTVTVHAPGTHAGVSDVPPQKRFGLPAQGGAPTAIAADATSFYVLTATAVEVLASSNGSLTRTIAGSATDLSGASSIAVDATSIYVANQTGSSVAVFPLAASGNVAPRLIAGVATGLSAPRGITVDNGSIYVANTGGADVLAFPAGGTGNIAPSRTLGGSSAGMITPYALGFDVSGNLYVADAGAQRVLLLPGARQGVPGPVQQIQLVESDVANGTGMSVWPH